MRIVCARVVRDLEGSALGLCESVAVFSDARGDADGRRRGVGPTPETGRWQERA